MAFMSTRVITCRMCGSIFDPRAGSDCAKASCPSCPLQQGCSLVRCPSCGYENVDISRSSLVMLFSRWRKRAQNRGFFGQRKGWKGKRNPTPHLLSELPPGSHAHIIGFQPFLSPERKTRLQAYGLTPGQEVLIIQQFPVTIVAIGHLELALENELAKLILTAT